MTTALNAVKSKSPEATASFKHIYTLAIHAFMVAYACRDYKESISLTGSNHDKTQVAGVSDSFLPHCVANVDPGETCIRKKLRGMDDIKGCIYTGYIYIYIYMRCRFNVNIEISAY